MQNAWRGLCVPAKLKLLKRQIVIRALLSLLLLYQSPRTVLGVSGLDERGVADSIADFVKGIKLQES